MEANREPSISVEALESVASIWKLLTNYGFARTFGHVSGAAAGI